MEIYNKLDILYIGRASTAHFPSREFFVRPQPYLVVHLEYMMPLDRNESYWLLDEELVGAVHSPEARELSTYPDYGELKEALAAYAGVTPEQIFAAPGSASAIEHIARAYAGDGADVLLPVPTFYGYETILEYVGAKTIPIVYEERNGQFVFPLAKTLEALASSSAKVLFLCHPNNPLGCPLTSTDIAALVAATKGSETVLAVDEAYFEFSAGASFLPYLTELPNLILLRSLSKSFGLAGARVGYAIAAPEVVKKLESIMIPWAIAHQSTVAALALLNRADAVKSRRAIFISAREHLIESLRMIPGVVVYPSETNFVLIRVGDAARVRTMLLAEGIRVASGESMSDVGDAKALLANTLRIVVPAPESEAFFIQALQKAVL